MKRFNVVSAAAGLLAASLSLTWTGCSQSSQDNANQGSSAAQPVQSIGAKSNAPDELAQEQTATRFSDAKLYCLGMLLYAEKHGYMFPTNLDQTLPYLSAANSLPSGTNHFDILFRGSIRELPNPLTNGIIVIRGDACQTADGRWIRVYGFVDGHCETRSGFDNNFADWEKGHSLP